jgi:hypothetical protein
MIGLNNDSTNQQHKKRMRSLVLLFLIFLVHEAFSGVPVRCAVRRQALLSVETETLEPCITDDKSRQPICQFACKNEIVQFINLKNFDYKFKIQYITYCHSQNQKGNYCDCRAFADSIGQTNWFNSNVVAPFCPSDVKPIFVKPVSQIMFEHYKNRGKGVSRPQRDEKIHKVKRETLSDEINEEIRALESEMEEFE